MTWPKDQPSEVRLYKAGGGGGGESFRSSYKVNPLHQKAVPQILELLKWASGVRERKCFHQEPKAREVKPSDAMWWGGAWRYPESGSWGGA